MRKIRFRVVLPIVFGFLAVVLFTWDYQNERVIESMGMGWDIGPPMWPYQAVRIISYAINAPAYEASRPILKFLDPRTYSLQYAVWFPAIVAVWWWVGRCIDFGLLGRRNYSHRKFIAASLLIGAVALLSLATYLGLDDYHWARQYWRGHPPVYAFLFSGPRAQCSGAFSSPPRLFVPRRALRSVGHLPGTSTALTD